MYSRKNTLTLLFSAFRSAPQIQKEEAGNVFVIRPNAPLKIGATEKDPTELQRVYELGRAAAISNLDSLKNYLGYAS